MLTADLFQALADNMNLLIAALNPDGNYTYANAAHRVLGYNANELIGKSLMQFVPREELFRVRLIFRKHSADKSDQTFMKFGILSKSGKLHSIKGVFHTLTDSDQKIVKVVFAGFDVTAEQHEQAAISQERDLLTEVVDGAAVGTWQWYVQSWKTIFNERWANMLGYRLSELEPANLQTWWKLCHPQDLQPLQRILEKHLAGTLPELACECRMRHREGYWIWVEIRGRVVQRSDAGHPIVMAGIFIDVSRRKQAESRKQITPQPAEATVPMVTGVIHHYNNLLTAASGNLELLQNDVSEVPALQERLAAIRQTLQQATTAGELMLAWLDRSEPVMAPLDVSQFCRQYLTRLPDTLPPSITLTSTLPPAGPVIQADSGRLQQILSNLFNNAQDALNGRAGVIHLAVTTVAAGDIPAINCRPENFKATAEGYACMAISNTGETVRIADLEKLFEPLYTTRHIGRGLGLPVALAAVIASRGCIAVTHHPDQGTVFQVFLPLIGEPLPAPVSLASPSVTLKAKTVLLVEDESHVRKMAATMLARLGCLVIEARDGLEAVELFQRHQNDIDAVICDLTMPRMDGWETLNALRQRSPNLPVILVSAHNQARVMAGARESERRATGADLAGSPQGFLRKPYTQSALEDALIQALGFGGDL